MVRIFFLSSVILLLIMDSDYTTCSFPVTITHPFTILTDATISIIESCLMKDNFGIVLWGNFDNFDHRRLNARKPIIISSQLLSSVNLKDHKFNNFVISIDMNFEDELRVLKKSPWWNSDGLFVMFDGTFRPSQGCKNALNILMTAWKMDILQTVFLCDDPNHGLFLYTFNPFTSRAPHFWEKVKEASARKCGENGTFYRLKYSANSIICNNIFFDKTRHLDGYSGIKVLAQNKFFRSESRRGGKVHASFDGAMAKIIFHTLNATLEYQPVRKIGYMDKNGIPVGNLSKISDGSHDITLIRRYLGFTNSAVQSTIFFAPSLIIVSKSQLNVTIVSHFLNMFGMMLIIKLLCVSFAIVLIFTLASKKNLSSAIFEMIRYWLTFSFHKIPADHISRLFLCNILLSGLIMQSYLEGSVLSFITTPVPLESIDDYTRLYGLKNYKIYHHVSLFPYIGEELQNRSSVENDLNKCFVRVVNDSFSVCIHDHIEVTYFTIKLGLHASKKNIMPNYWIYHMRKNWPLITRINTIINRMFETGLVNNISVRYKRRRTKNLKVPIKNDQLNLSVTHEDLKNALIILGFGLLLSSICFFLEICIYSFQEYLKT